MSRLLAVAVVVLCFVPTMATASGGSGGISPDPDQTTGTFGIGDCSATRHGSTCHMLEYRNEDPTDRAGLLKVSKTDDRGVSPMRGTVLLEKRVDGEWITLDRRSHISRSNADHTTQRLRVYLPIMHITDEPHRLIARMNGKIVAELRL